MLISTPQFCTLVGIGHDRFEQRRLRERAAADVASTLDADGHAHMPITPSGHGQRAEYDAYDALRLRAVVKLERAGMAFSEACLFIGRAGISPNVMFSNGGDFFAAQWLETGGAVRRVCGDARDLTRAMPEAALAAVRVNLSAIRDDVAKRALAQLGLGVEGCNFSEDPVP